MPLFSLEGPNKIKIADMADMDIILKNNFQPLITLEGYSVHPFKQKYMHRFSYSLKMFTI